MADPKLETWQNTSRGNKWYKCFDVQGRETTKVVRGGHTFVLTTQERQMNQEISRPQQDLFRNGTFVLKKPSVETLREEIDTPDAMTDADLEQIQRDVTYGEANIGEIVAEITSLNTLQRLLEFFTIDEGSRKSDMDVIKARRQELNPGAAANETSVVMTKPETEPKPIKVSPGGAVIPEPQKIGH